MKTYLKKNLVYAKLQSEIESGERPFGAMLSGEERLAVEFGIAR